MITAAITLSGYGLPCRPGFLSVLVRPQLVLGERGFSSGCAAAAGTGTALHSSQGGFRVFAACFRSDSRLQSAPQAVVGRLRALGSCTHHLHSAAGCLRRTGTAFGEACPEASTHRRTVQSHSSGLKLMLLIEKCVKNHKIPCAEMWWELFLENCKVVVFLHRCTKGHFLSACLVALDFLDFISKKATYLIRKKKRDNNNSPLYNLTNEPVASYCEGYSNRSAAQKAFVWLHTVAQICTAATDQTSFSRAAVKANEGQFKAVVFTGLQNQFWFVNSSGQFPVDAEVSVRLRFVT